MGRTVPTADFGAVPYGGDAWRIEAGGDALKLESAPPVFTIGNGFIGVRCPGDPAGSPRVYLNGVFETVPIPYHEAAHGYALSSDTRLAVADATDPRIMIDGAPVGPAIRVALDLRRGVLEEEYRVGEIEVATTRLVSMTRPSLFACRISVRAEFAERLSVDHLVTPPPMPEAANADLYDPRMPPPVAVNPWVEQSRCDDTPVRTRVDLLPGSGAVVAVACSMGDAVATGPLVAWDVLSAYTASGNEPLADAVAAVGAAREAGFDELLSEHADWWAAHWRTSATGLPDHPAGERILHLAQLQLAQAVGRDGSTSISAKGQTGEGYEGHVFWDADLYVLPMFAFTRPDIARSMLLWRIGGLPAARANARAMGQRTGALYPWRTIGGSECSSFFPAGSAQYHINADVAYALRTYLAATGDRTVLNEGGAEMLVETARIWLEIGFHDKARGGAFVINRVTGPDEYSAIVDNNLYTNLMAAEHLRHAAEVGVEAGLLDEAEAGRMVVAADEMLLPFDERAGVYAQDDAFFGKEPWPFEETADYEYPLLLHHHPLKLYRHQVSKQADAVLALALMPDRFELPMALRMIRVYEAVTVHDSTLSASAFATACARAGDAGAAATYWRTALLTDVCDLFGNTGHGLHMAAMAGSWTTMAMGFAGMAVAGTVLCFNPVAIPEIGTYCLRVVFRGSLVEVTVDGADATYELLDGDPVMVSHKGGKITLSGPKVSIGLAA